MLKDCQDDGEHIKSSPLTSANKTDEKKLLGKDDETVHVDDQTVFVYSTKAPASLKNQWKASSSNSIKSIPSKPSMAEKTAKSYSFEKVSKKSTSGHERKSLSSEDSDDDLSIRQRNRYRALSRKLKSSRIGHRKRKSIRRNHHQSYIHKKRRKFKRETKRKR